MGPSDMEKIIWRYDEQLIHNFDNFDIMDQFLEKYVVPPFTQYELNNLNSPHYLDTTSKKQYQNYQFTRISVMQKF